MFLKPWEFKMKHIEWLRRNVGKECKINGDGDLALTHKELVYSPHFSKIVKVTKGGMVIVVNDGKEYSVPSRNVEPLK